MNKLFDRAVSRTLFPSEVQDSALAEVMERAGTLLDDDVACVHVVAGGHVAEGATESVLIDDDGSITIGSLAFARGVEEAEPTDAKSGLGKTYYGAISAAIARTEVPIKFKRMAAEALAARFEELSGSFQRPAFLRAVLRGAAEEEEPETTEESLDEAAPTRRHFAMIAQAMAELDMPMNYKRALVGAVAGALGDAPQFNHTRFVKATGLSAGQVKEEKGEDEEEPEDDEEEPEDDDEECESELLVCYHPTGVQLVDESGTVLALQRCNTEDPIASARAIDAIVEHAQALGFELIDEVETLEEGLDPDSDEALALECDAIDDLRTYVAMFVQECSAEELHQHAATLRAIDEAVNEGDYELAEELAEPLLEYKRMAQSARRMRIRSMRLGVSKAVRAGKVSRSEHRRGLVKRRRQYRSSSGQRAKAKRYAKRYQRFRRRLRPVSSSRSESVEEGAALKVKCQECGKTFSTKQDTPKCPKCGSTDVDLPESYYDIGDGPAARATKRAVARGKPVDWDKIAPDRGPAMKRAKEIVTQTYNKYFDRKSVSILKLGEIKQAIENLLTSGKEIDADMKALVKKYAVESVEEAGDQLGVLAGEVMTFLLNRPRATAEDLVRRFRMSASAASRIMDIAAQALAAGQGKEPGYNAYVKQIGDALAQGSAFESAGADRTFLGSLTEETAPWVYVSWEDEPTKYASGAKLEQHATLWKKNATPADSEKARKHAESQHKGRVHLGTARTTLDQVRAAHRAGKSLSEARYGGDPRWIQAKYAGEDVNGVPFKKGERVLYYPNGKKIVAGPKAEQGWREFLSAAGDEAGMPYAEAITEASAKRRTPVQRSQDDLIKGYGAHLDRALDKKRAAGEFDVSWGEFIGAVKDPSGTYVLRMHRKGQKVRFFSEEGKQVGPEQSNIAPAFAWAASKGLVMEGLRGEGAAEGHQLRIALSTLKMHRIGARVMGGMNHEQSVALLLKNGYTEAKLRSMLKGYGHEPADIDAMFGQDESVDEALDLRVVYEKSFYAAQARLAGEMDKAVKLDREIDRLARQFERQGQADEVLVAEELGRQDADGNDEPRPWNVVRGELEGMTSESVDEANRGASLIHIQKDSFVSVCGRKLGTPGGKIYPGVFAQLPKWFETHRFPAALHGRVCKRCLDKAGLTADTKSKLVAPDATESHVLPIDESVNIPFNSEHEIRDPKSRGSDAAPTIKVPALRLARATVLMPGSMMGNWNKVEVNDLVVYKAPYAQYEAALHVQFRAKGKRKTVGRAEGSHPRLVVYEGWGIDLEPESMLGDPKRDSPTGLEVRQSRRMGFDKGWDEEMERRVQALPKKPVLAIFEGLDEAAPMFQGPDGPTSVAELIRPGDRVTILVHAGIGRDGPERRPATGKAVMRGPGGWVLNMGGPHGRPGIASDSNVVSIKRGGQWIYKGTGESIEEAKSGLPEVGDEVEDVWKPGRKGRVFSVDHLTGDVAVTWTDDPKRKPKRMVWKADIDYPKKRESVAEAHDELGRDLTGDKLHGFKAKHTGPKVKPKLKSEKPWFLVKEGDKLRAGQSTEDGAKKHMKPGRTLVRGKMRTLDYDGITASEFVPESVSSSDPVVEAFNASLRKKLRSGDDDARYARMVHTGKRKVVRGLKKVAAKVRADLEPNDLRPGALESLDEVTKGTAEVFTMLLSSYLTQYDQQQQARAMKRRGGYHSPYALGHYFKALDDVRTAVGQDLQSDSKEAIAKLQAAVRDAFDENFPPVKKLLKATAAFRETGKLPTLKQEFRESELDEWAEPAQLDEAKSSVKVGDRVAYKASFLRSIGSFTGLGHLRGRVTKLEKFGEAQLATIEWENGDAPDRVLAPNLSVVSPERGIADESIEVSESDFIDLLNGTYLHPAFGIVDETHKAQMLEGTDEAEKKLRDTPWQQKKSKFGYGYESYIKGWLLDVSLGHYNTGWSWAVYDLEGTKVAEGSIPQTPHLDQVNAAKKAAYVAYSKAGGGGPDEGAAISAGDNAHVPSINKTGMVVAVSGSKITLKFVDGTRRVFERSDIEPVADWDEAETEA